MKVKQILYSGNVTACQNSKELRNTLLNAEV